MLGFKGNNKEDCILSYLWYFFRKNGLTTNSKIGVVTIIITLLFPL